MRVNVYAEEMTERIEIISKQIEGCNFTGLRLYLELPVTTQDGINVSGPFIHQPGDDDSAAITFWGKKDLRIVLRKMLETLDEHYEKYTGPVAKTCQFSGGCMKPKDCNAGGICIQSSAYKFEKI